MKKLKNYKDLRFQSNMFWFSWNWAFFSRFIIKFGLDPAQTRIFQHLLNISKNLHAPFVVKMCRLVFPNKSFTLIAPSKVMKKVEKFSMSSLGISRG